MKEILKAELMKRITEKAGDETETKRNTLAWVEEVFDGMGIAGTISEGMMEKYISILENTRSGLSAGSDGYTVIDGAIHVAYSMIGRE